MIRRGESIESLKYLRLCPLFARDDAVYHDLPQWTMITEQISESQECPRSAACQGMIQQELSKACPNYTMIACLQLVMDDASVPKLLALIDGAAEAESESYDELSSNAAAVIEHYWKQRLQHRIDLQQWRSLYQWISRRLHIISVDHPLHLYATTCLPRLTSDERNRVARLLKMSAPRTSVLGLMKQIQDRHPATRLYAVILEHPCPFRHSCLATATLEWQNQSPASGSKSVSVTALYDLMNKDDATISLIHDEDENDSVEDRMRALNARTGESCACLRCRHELDATFAMTVSDRLQLARFYLIKGRLKVANELYQQILEEQPGNLDAWHARGAIELSHDTKRFLEAQRIWAQAVDTYPDSRSGHVGLSLQADKLHAYRYFRDLPLLRHANNTTQNFDAELPNVFSTPMLDGSACQQVLDWARAAGNWTQNRHYAVPTYDVPVHTVPSLLEWFNTWFHFELRTLLARQFGTSTNYYVHDAFVVQYQATASSNYLPLHTDESTHSFVLALNDCSEYCGGGTYFYKQDVTHRAKVGELISFRGDQVLHGGEAVSEGTRFILAGFLYHDDDGKEVPECSSSTATTPSAKRELKSTSVGEVIREAKTQKVDFNFGFVS